MAMEAHDGSSDTSSTTCTAHTPQTEATEASGHCVQRHDRSAIPWHGCTFLIVEKNTDWAITMLNDRLCLQDIEDSMEGTNHWFCVEQDGYFGFQNPKSGKYLGHDGKHGIIATATKLRGWELFTPRHHPSGGYQLLQPHWSQQLMVICVRDGGVSLARRDHGTTLWEFILV